MEDFHDVSEALHCSDVLRKQEDITVRITLPFISNRSQTSQIDNEDKTGRGTTVQSTISYTHIQNFIKLELLAGVGTR